VKGNIVFVSTNFKKMYGEKENDGNEKPFTIFDSFLSSLFRLLDVFPNNAFPCDYSFAISGSFFFFSFFFCLDSWNIL